MSLSFYPRPVKRKEESDSSKRQISAAVMGELTVCSPMLSSVCGGLFFNLLRQGHSLKDYAGGIKDKATAATNYSLGTRRKELNVVPRLMTRGIVISFWPRDDKVIDCRSLMRLDRQRR